MQTGLYKEEDMNDAINVFEKIERWGTDRNFYGEGGADVKGQFVKLAEEFGELAGNIARGKDCSDDIGDMVVVLTHLAKLSGTNILKCIEHSYAEIKHRKGMFKNGFYIKEQDL